MRWGGGAIAAFALAVLAGNFSAFLPETALTGLHATRLDGGNLTLLKTEVERLRADLARADRTDALLDTRIALIEDNRTNTARRIGALEASVPMLLEALPYDADIDYALLTASIGEAETIPAQGGEATVRQSPLFMGDGTTPPGAPVETASRPVQAMPAALDAAAPDASAAEAFGLALGAAVPPERAWDSWLAIAEEVGSLLIGLRPVLAPDENGDGASRLIAGPIAGYAQAIQLCAAISSQDVACQTTTFEGTAITLPAADTKS